jgi:hypothetical protein
VSNLCASEANASSPLNRVLTLESGSSNDVLELCLPSGVVGLVLIDSWTNVLILSVANNGTFERSTADVLALRWPNVGVESLDIIEDPRENSLGAWPDDGVKED